MSTLESAMAGIASLDAAIAQRQGPSEVERNVDECVDLVLRTCDRAARYSDFCWNELREGRLRGKAHEEGMFLREVLERLERVLLEVKREYLAEKGLRFNRSADVAQRQLAMRNLLDRVVQKWPFIDMKQLEESQSAGSAEVWRDICSEENGCS